MLSNIIVSGVTYAIPATKIHGGLDILFCILDVNLSISCILSEVQKSVLQRNLKIKPVDFDSYVFLSYYRWIQENHEAFFSLLLLPSSY